MPFKFGSPGSALRTPRATSSHITASPGPQMIGSSSRRITCRPPPVLRTSALVRMGSRSSHFLTWSSYSTSGDSTPASPITAGPRILQSRSVMKPWMAATSSTLGVIRFAGPRSHALTSDSRSSSYPRCWALVPGLAAAFSFPPSTPTSAADDGVTCVATSS